MGFARDACSAWRWGRPGRPRRKGNLRTMIFPIAPAAPSATMSCSNKSASGGMGVVYRARERTLNRVVALKLNLAGSRATEAEIKRFHTEAEAAATLQHPNVVAIHEVGEHEGQHYISMDYVEGKSLAEVIRRTPLPAARAARYVKIIAEAIHYAHQRGILHRDLKPHNVLIDAEDEPRITDFGLARQIEVDIRPHGLGRGARHAELHAPRAGRRQTPGDRSSQRRLFARRDSLRPAHGPPAVPRRHTARARCAR